MTIELKQRDIVVTRVFDVSSAQVWSAWSEAAQIMQWWGPTGFTSPSARIDFREGGTSLVCMRAPIEWGGQDMYNTWTYTKIVPMQYIEFIQNFADKDGNRIDPASIGLPSEAPQDARSTVTLKALEGGKTEMTVAEYNYTSEQMSEMSKLGLEQCLDKMAASFALV